MRGAGATGHGRDLGSPTVLGIFVKILRLVQSFLLWGMMRLSAPSGLWLFQTTLGEKGRLWLFVQVCRRSWLAIPTKNQPRCGIWPSEGPCEQGNKPGTPQQEVCESKYGRERQESFFKKNLLFARLDIETSHAMVTAGSTCSMAAGASLRREDCPAGKAGCPSGKPSLQWENTACVDKKARILFFRGLFFSFPFAPSFQKETSEEPQFQHPEIRIFANLGVAPGVAGRVFIHPSHSHTYTFPPHPFFFSFPNPVTFQNVSSFGKITAWQIYNVFFCTFAAE